MCMSVHSLTVKPSAESGLLYPTTHTHTCLDFAVAFGNQRGRCEVFLYTDDPDGSSASAELRQVHAGVPESQRFYYLPQCGMSYLECALELHSLCVRVTELIDDQANR